MALVAGEAPQPDDRQLSAADREYPDLLPLGLLDLGGPEPAEGTAHPERRPLITVSRRSGRSATTFTTRLRHRCRRTVIASGGRGLLLPIARHNRAQRAPAFCRISPSDPAVIARFLGDLMCVMMKFILHGATAWPMPSPRWRVCASGILCCLPFESPR